MKMMAVLEVLIVLVALGAAAYGFRQEWRNPTPKPRTVATITSRRPTVPRVGFGLILGGIPGGLLGLAFRKKSKERIQVYDDDTK